MNNIVGFVNGNKSERIVQLLLFSMFNRNVNYYNYKSRL